jgi:tRNA uridine 5-carboxymethylaminomethyl modification enzyme
LIHIGFNRIQGGRAGEAAAIGLTSSLKDVGLQIGRLKTGTPPRLLRQTIDFSKTTIKPGDEPVPYFTYWKDELFHVEQNGSHPKFHSCSNNKYPPGSILDRVGGQTPCYITYTSQKTAEVIRSN